MSDCKASIVCAVFNEQHEFQDILLIGIADNIDRARSLLMNDILRVVRDFGSGKCEIEESGEHNNPVIIVHIRDETNDEQTMYLHYYCMFDESEEEE